jgi:hypothetical protein
LGLKSSANILVKGKGKGISRGLIMSAHCSVKMREEELNKSYETNGRKINVLPQTHIQKYKPTPNVSSLGYGNAPLTTRRKLESDSSYPR